MRTPATHDQPQDEALDRLTRLQTLTASLSEAVTSEQVADVILAQTVAVLGAEAGVIYRLSADGSEFVCLRATGDPDGVAAARGRFPAAARTPISAAVRLTRPVVVPTPAELRARYPDAVDVPTLQGEGTMIALPLLIWGEAVGGIGLRFSGHRTFSEQDRSFLLTVAGLCAQALERARLYDVERMARERAERDAEERRQANEALRQSEARFRGVVQCNMIGVGFWDADGRLTEPNDALLRITGYSREDFNAGRVRWPDLTPAMYHPRDSEALAELRATGGCTPYEKEYIRKDGTRIPVLLGGGGFADGPDRGPFFALDISALKQAERESRLSRERLDLVANSVEIGLWYCDLPFDRLAWNAKVKEHFGLPPDFEVTIETFYERLHPDDRERTRRAIERSIAERNNYDIEYRTVGLDGRERWVRAIGRAFYDAMGRPSRFDGITVDVTERVRQAEALQEADRRKDEFLAMLAHELRNPLAPIRNAVQVFRLLGPADPDLRWAGDMIGRQVEHLAHLVDDLLDVSRITRGKVALQKEPFELAVVVARAVETSRPLIAARRHELDVVLPREPLRVDADPTRLAQVFSNLLNNAAKYTEEHGHIELTVESVPGGAVVRVRDDGMGIPAELLPRVFDLFTQGDRSLARSEGGLGIGLTLVKSLVELHGGTVEARSDGPGRGSEFVVRLPAMDAGPARLIDGDAGGPMAALSPPPRRVLVVDDNADAADSLAMVLRADGHDTRTAYDGPSALAAAAEFAPEFVFLEIGLPRMDGFEVARRLRLRPEPGSIYLVALTGYGQDADRRRVDEAGFDAHLVKPADPEAVQRLLGAGGGPR